MILFLTNADTELLALRVAAESLPAAFPAVRAANPGRLTEVPDLSEVDVVVVRLLGGRQAWPERFDELRSRCSTAGLPLLAFGGEAVPDAEMAAASTVAPGILTDAFAYLVHGGVQNITQLLRFVADTVLLTGHGFEPPRPVPTTGIYHPSPTGRRRPAGGAGDGSTPEALPGRPARTPVRDAWTAQPANGPASSEPPAPPSPDRGRPVVGIVFYRAHLLAGNTGFVDDLCAAVEAAGGTPVAVHTYSLRPDGSGAVQAAELLADAAVDVVVTTTLAAGALDDAGECWDAGALARLDVPVVQGICATTGSESWEGSSVGLSPTDVAMSVAIPEFDGRIVSVPLSFKEVVDDDDLLGTPLTAYRTVPDRVARVAGLAVRLGGLRRCPPADRKIAVVLSAYPTRRSRLGNAVGLDTPASVVDLLHAMAAAGYRVDRIPEDGDALMAELADGMVVEGETPSTDHQRRAAGQMEGTAYATWLATVPAELAGGVSTAWGEPPGTVSVVPGPRLLFGGLDLGGVLVAVQPPRGFGENPVAVYHSPDLPPTHHYLAFYQWLQRGWGADAVVHVGKHGTLEWLPGKGVGLSSACAPDAALGDLPLVYPFVVNDPGEGTQAKRRAHAVVVDHLVPPLTRAETYDDLARLERVLDDHARIAALDPAKLPAVRRQVWECLVAAEIHRDLGLAGTPAAGAAGTSTAGAAGGRAGAGAAGAPAGLGTVGSSEGAGPTGGLAESALAAGDAAFDDPAFDDPAFDDLLPEIDGYLCELKDAQIRGGLHVLGRAPEGEAEVDLVLAITRLPQGRHPSLRVSVAAALGLDLDDGGRHHVDAVEAACRRLVEHCQHDAWQPPAHDTLAALLAGRPVPGTPDPAAPGSAEGAARDVAATSMSTSGGGAVSTQAVDAVSTAGAHATSGITATPDPAAVTAPAPLSTVARVLGWVCSRLVPDLRATTGEIDAVLAALDGRFVPPGPSGAPSRGQAHVLPTGRNFYAVDPRGVPSPLAWDVGRALADRLVDRHRSEEGRVPSHVALVVWGTAAMRTGGDDIAEALALLGVRPRWALESGRVDGLQVMTLQELGRPRVDVTLRVSGFFRDAFPHVVALVDEAATLVAALDEPPEQNPLVGRGAEARVFGPKPGAYGSGILAVLESRQWRSDEDLAAVYLAWGGWSYRPGAMGAPAGDALRSRLAAVDVAVKNQDNREHDIFDSDDYLQDHGGMVATIRALTGRQPKAWFGDSADPARPRVRSLAEEAARVVRSRVVNPKWTRAMMRHGYKGAFEMAATVDYLFGYDATARVVEDWMYERVTDAYVADAEVRKFFERSNPWALRSIAERLLEADERGLWHASDRARGILRAALLEAEGWEEDR